MIDPIDDLFNRAFSKKDIPFKEEYWTRFEAGLPPAPSGFKALLSSTSAKVGLAAVATAGMVGLGALFLNDSGKEQIAVVHQVNKQLLTKETAQETQKLKNNSTLELAPEVFMNQKTEHEHENSELKSVGDRQTTQIKQSNSPSNYQKENSNLNPELAKSETTKKRDNIGIDSKINKEEIGAEDEQLKQLPLASMVLADMNGFSKEYSTEFNHTVPKANLSRVFVNLVGGYHYIDSDGLNDLQTSGNFKDLLVEITSQSESEIGLNIGYQTNNLRFYTGIQLNTLNQTYIAKYTESFDEVSSTVNSRYESNGFDSTFVKHEYGINEVGGKQRLQIVNSVYQVDTLWKTVYDTSLTVQTKKITHEEKAAYQLQYLQVPVMAGYQIQFKKFFVELNTGISIGILAKFSGNVFDEETGALKGLVEKDKLNPVTLKYNLEAGFGYQITPRLAFSINPTIIHALNGPFKQESKLNYNYTSYGVRSSLRFGF